AGDHGMGGRAADHHDRRAVMQLPALLRAVRLRIDESQEIVDRHRLALGCGIRHGLLLAGAKIPSNRHPSHVPALPPPPPRANGAGMIRSALYTGTFDPVTNGHLDVVRRACRLADRLVIAIGVHTSKTPIFSAEERAEMLRAVCTPIAEETGTALEVVTFDDLTVDAARRLGATIIVRGLRDGTDLDYEMQMA